MYYLSNVINEQGGSFRLGVYLVDLVLEYNLFNKFLNTLNLEWDWTKLITSKTGSFAVRADRRTP